VHEWFRTYYGAANAVIVIAGDIDPETARAKVEQYFGDIPSGPPGTKHETWVAPRTGTRRQIMQDRVPQARVHMAWNIPEWGSEDGTYLNLVTRVLAAGKTSRFYRRLVYDEQIATGVHSFVSLREIAGQLKLRGTVRPGVELSQVERALTEELERFLREGPTDTELQRVKTQYRARFIRGIERIGGFGGKSDVLAMNEVYGGSPDFYQTTLARVANATAENLREAAVRWLSDGVYILETHPFPEYSTIATDVDRSALPEPGAPPTARFPELQRATLSNGLQVILAERHAVPVVNMRLMMDAGYAADQSQLPGTASLAMTMLAEGTRNQSALEISDELAMLGATLGTGSDLDMSTVSFSALTENLDPSLDIFADVVLNPSFPEEDFRRLQRQRIAQIQQEKMVPFQIVMRVFPGLLYGEDHAYGNPMTGSGTEESVQIMTRGDLREFYETWFKPNNATLVVVGAVTMGEIRPRLERLFGEWRRGEVPQKNLATVDHQPGSTVYIMNRPGAIQSIILAAHIAPPKSNPDEIAIETMNTMLGGDFSSRINMSLREDKHWSYGAMSALLDARGQRLFGVYAPVQSDKTKESIAEIMAELRGAVGERPFTQGELAFAQNTRTLTLPGSWETANAVATSISEIVRFGLDDRHFETYAERVRSLTLQQVQSVTQEVLQPNRIVWVVVGDLESIEAGIRELGIGPVYEIDADGNVLRELGL
jgi:zinc protease